VVSRSGREIVKGGIELNDSVCLLNFLNFVFIFWFVCCFHQRVVLNS
jgi:hypothetical protein